MKDPNIIIPRCPELEKALKDIPDEIIKERLDNLFNKEVKEREEKLK